MSDDPELRLAIEIAKTKSDEDWENLSKVIELYPQFFPFVQVTRDLFNWATFLVASRSFGWSIASTCLVPMGDNLNHDYKS